MSRLAGRVCWGVSEAGGGVILCRSDWCRKLG